MPSTETAPGVSSTALDSEHRREKLTRATPSEASLTPARPTKPVQFSLIFFSDDGSQTRDDKYELVLKAACYADQHDFLAVWTPERHFHPFGGLYPNPAVLGAAIAALTERIQIRAGSVVLPLHHPARIVEEWSMVDNLSHGRVGLSLASGWVPHDFVLATQPFDRRRQLLFEGIDTLKQLWRGEAVAFSTPEKQRIEVRVYPRPLQPEVPIWITTAGNPDTWVQAGEIGANILTGLLQQSIDDVKENVIRYREARLRSGHPPDTGIVSLMLHTFIWHDQTIVRRKVRDPLLNYMVTHMDIYKQMATIMGRSQDAERFTTDDKAALAELAFERYFNYNGLFGTPESCQRTVEHLQLIGINEIACLMDFGVSHDTVLESLVYLNQLREQYQQAHEHRDL